VRRSATLVAVAALVLGLAATPAFAGKPFQGSTSTADGYPTWDSDMIDIEQVDETGAGVYVAVLDTGLAPNWKDYFPEARVATELGKGFYQNVSFKAQIDDNDQCGFGVEVGPLVETTWVGSRGATHGTHVTSTILGYNYRSTFDALSGFDLGPIQVRGIAPEATVIPVKVLADYQVPALPKCDDPNIDTRSQNAVFGTDAMVAAGIDYVTDLAIAGYRPMVINMSLGGPELVGVERDALDRAIANGVIVVAAASNDGEEGMDYPGAYGPVISVGAVGSVDEWQPVTGGPGTYVRNRMWWLQYGTLGIDIPEPVTADDLYVTDFSSRELPDQELDVLAPGSWVRGPYPGTPGYNHLPWWSNGLGDVLGNNAGNFYYVGGTSMATPHVAAVAALMLEADPTLIQSEVEAILRSTALSVPDTGTRTVFDISPVFGYYDYSWDTTCEAAVDDLGTPIGPVPCDAVGWGLVQADAAVAAAS
jgi:subtilisin family serine protease